MQAPKYKLGTIGSERNKRPKSGLRSGIKPQRMVIVSMSVFVAAIMLRVNARPGARTPKPIPAMKLEKLNFHLKIRPNIKRMIVPKIICAGTTSRGGANVETGYMATNPPVQKIIERI